MQKYDLDTSIHVLAEEWHHLDFTFHHFHENNHDYLKNFWPGSESESVMVCVYRDRNIHEPFHRQDFFFFNYAWHNNYAALSDREGNLITIHEGECYIGQPFSGYALRSIENTESTIVGILIKKEVFFRHFLQTFVSDNVLFHFFLDPQKDRYADKYLHFSFQNSSEIKPLLQMMIIEYANRTEDSQQVLTALAYTLYLLIARTYHNNVTLVTNTDSNTGNNSPLSQILAYMDDHFQTVSLKELSARFSYHPNYISTLLHQETGKTFSEILLAKKMEHAVVLMSGTDLTNEEIADTLGYTSTANYYKSFRRYYHMTPREYAATHSLRDQFMQDFPFSNLHHRN